MSSNKVIGIAGGIGSGKSTVTDYLEKQGYPVYDADVEAHEAVKQGEPALNALVGYFSSDILNNDGSLNRRRLAQIAFSNPEKTSKLNEILHGDISRRLDEKIEKDRAPLSFISAPLFFEANLNEKCDETWAVIANSSLRIKRSMERDKLPRQEVLDRINRQMSDEERVKLADFVLVNEGSKEELIRQVDRLLAK